MFELLRPILGVILGLVLSLLSFVQGVRAFPGAAIWQQVVHAMPQFSAVLWFVLCAVMTLVGLVMFIVGISTCRQFYRHINRLPNHREPHYDERHEWA